MATLGSMLWLAPHEVAEAGVDLERDLLVTPKVHDKEETPEPIKQWRTLASGVVGVPVDYGLRVWGARDYDERLHLGKPVQVPRFPDPLHPKASPGQDKFFADMLDAVRNNYVVLAEAPTGSGKTVTALNTYGKLARTGVVVVPSNYLAGQWREEAMRHLGLSEDRIGLVGGGVDDWQGKDLVVVVLHNLFQKRYPRQFYHMFGTAMWDEAHNLGARQFSKTMHCFPAAHRFALSATPDRKDGCAVVFTNQFGEVSVRSTQKALACHCYIQPFRHRLIPGNLRYARNNTKALMWLARCEERNKLLVRKACELYDKGYQLLMLSKYIDHCELLIRMLVDAGIPAGEIGQFTGKANREHTFKTGPRAGTTVVRREEVKEEELDFIKKHSQVIVGTYSMLKEGVDIPRLDAGMECLPVADGRQAIGRIRRPHPDKEQEPVWVTVEDTNIYEGSGLEFLWGFTAARLRGYRETGVTIKRLAA